MCPSLRSAPWLRIHPDRPARTLTRQGRERPWRRLWLGPVAWFEGTAESGSLRPRWAARCPTPCGWYPPQIRLRASGRPRSGGLVDRAAAPSDPRACAGGRGGSWIGRLRRPIHERGVYADGRGVVRARTCGGCRVQGVVCVAAVAVTHATWAARVTTGSPGSQSRRRGFSGSVRVGVRAGRWG